MYFEIRDLIQMEAYVLKMAFEFGLNFSMALIKPVLPTCLSSWFSNFGFL